MGCTQIVYGFFSASPKACLTHKTFATALADIEIFP